MASNAVATGPTAERVARNVERIRKARHLKQKDLSDLLETVGRPTLPTVISKIERGERRIDVDDLVALALALNVSPLTLLLPDSASEETVSITEGVEVATRTAWGWGMGQTAAGERPVATLSATDPGYDEQYDAQQEFGRRQLAYQALALPEEIRQVKNHPAVRVIRQLEDFVLDLLLAPSGETVDTLAPTIRLAQRRYQQFGIELEEIIEQLNNPKATAEGHEDETDGPS